MARLPTHLEELFRKDGIWWDFFKMPQHLDSPLEIDFTDIQVKEFIQCPSLNLVVYVLWFNPDQSAEGFSTESAIPRSLHIPATSRGSHNLRRY